MPENRLVNYVPPFYLNFASISMSGSNIKVLLKYCKGHICLAGESVSVRIFDTTEIIIGPR